jgi:hypothetical protein
MRRRRVYELIVLIIIAILLGICLTVAPAIVEDTRDSARRVSAMPAAII